MPSTRIQTCGLCRRILGICHDPSQHSCPRVASGTKKSAPGIRAAKQRRNLVMNSKLHGEYVERESCEWALGVLADPLLLWSKVSWVFSKPVFCMHASKCSGMFVCDGCVWQWHSLWQTKKNNVWARSKVERNEDVVCKCVRRVSGVWICGEWLV